MWINFNLIVMKKILIIGAAAFALFITGCFNSGPCLNGYGPVVNEIRELSDFTAVSNSFEYEVRVTQSDTFGVEVEAQENLHQLIETYVSGSTLIVKTQNSSCINSSVPVVVYVSMPYIEEIRNTGSGRLSADRSEVTEFECSNSGSGVISIDSVFASSIKLKNSGSGKLYVSASFPDEINMTQTGSGLIDAGYVDQPLDVNINNTGSGKVYATIVDGLVVDARLSGSGLILLDGFAEMADFSLSSSGKIDAMELEVADAKTLISGSGKIFVYATEKLDVVITGSGDVLYRGHPLITTRITGSGDIRPY
jgi:Putative auto-transporter adhesin, head GIN domain